MQRSVRRCQTFDGDHRDAVRLHRKHKARSCRCSINDNGASSTHPMLAAKVCASKAEILSKEIAEMLSYWSGALVGDAVNGQSDFFSSWHSSAPKPSSLRSRTCAAVECSPGTFDSYLRRAHRSLHQAL